MQVQVHPVQQNWTSFAIPIGIIVIVMALRMRRMGKMRPLKLEICGSSQFSTSLLPF